MLEYLANGLVIAGICLLIGALIPVGQLIRQIPAGSVRHRWHFLILLIVIFIVGYLSYIAVFWDRHHDWLALIVPAIFLSGAGFVWLTATLSLQTASDIRRVVLLEQENITDPLIGIYNRRYLDRRLEEELARAQRYEMPLSVLLLDIDRFKRINDAFGHQVGDQVLIYLGKLILEVIRASDVAARFGGEELVIIAPNTTVPLAVSLAERLRHHIETHALVLSTEPGQRQEIHITVSIGVACLTRDVTDAQRLVGCADDAMYRAKQEGRNRVVTSISCVSSGAHISSEKAN